MGKGMENFGVKLLKGLLIGVSVSLASILVFALVLKFVNMSAFWIKLVNQFIKLASIFVACLVAVGGSKGLLKGVAVGLSVVGVTYLLFGLVSGGLSIGISVVWEAVYGILAGGLAGIISANLKK